MRSRAELRSYQRDCVEFISRNPKVAIFAALGGGKTSIALTAIADLMAEFMVQRVLVLSTKRIIRMVWPHEPQEWEHTAHLRVVSITGTPSERAQALRTPAEIHATNFENLEWLVQHLGADWPFDMLVIDESSAFKSHDSNRFRALVGGRVPATRTKGEVRYEGVLKRIQRVVLLTGSPAPAGLADLWAQFFLLDFGARLGRNITAFRSRWFDQNPYTMQWVPKTHAQADIESRIADLCRIVESYDGMPDVMFNTVRIDLGETIQNEYTKFQRQQLLELKGQEITAANAAALATKLLQFSNGAIYDDQRRVHQIHDLKLLALEEIISQASGQPVLVSYAFQHDLARLKSKFPHAEVLDDNPETERRWNAGKIPLLIAHPKSCGHGLNLQHGGSILVWFGLTWSLELFLQMNARLARSGQKRAVIIHTLVSANTLDERVLSVLSGKEANQAALLANIKELVTLAEDNQ